MYAAAAALAFGLASAASAAVVVDTGPPGNPYFPGLDSVHNAGTQTGTTVFGDLDGPAPNEVTFTSPDTLHMNGNGVSQINGPWDTITFFLTDNGLFNRANFAVNLNDLNQGGPAILDVTAAVSGSGNVLALDNFALGNGENRFAISGTNNELFSSITLRVFTSNANDTAREVDSLRQVEIGRAGGGQAVPEPATWALMILGFGGAGAMLRRRRTAMA